MFRKLTKRIVLATLSEDRLFRINNILNRYKVNKKLRTNLPAPSPQAEALFRDGIIVVNDFWSAEKCEHYKKLILDFSAQYQDTVTLATGTKVYYRGRNNDGDTGMIDIKHIDREIPDLSILIEEGKQFVATMNYAARGEFALVSLNAYINDGVTDTRGFHIDDAVPTTYKAFVYLTDVADVSYGPYTYVKGSQRFNPHVYLSLARNMLNAKREWGQISHYDKKRVWPVLGKKGTLILSDQTGIHRGLPQQNRKLRVALVLNYIEKDYLDAVSKKDLGGDRSPGDYSAPNL